MSRSLSRFPIPLVSTIAYRLSRANSLLTFDFDGWGAMGPWLADGILLGDSLIVKYNDVMLWTDFEDGVYLQTIKAASRNEDPMRRS